MPKESWNEAKADAEFGQWLSAVGVHTVTRDQVSAETCTQGPGCMELLKHKTARIQTILMAASKPETLSHSQDYPEDTPTSLNILHLPTRRCHVIKEKRREKRHGERKTALSRSLIFKLLNNYSNLMRLS